MFRILIIAALLLWTVWLIAVPPFVPKTTIAEDFATLGCVSCLDANAGLDVLHSQYHPGEFFSLRYYLNSPNVGNPDADARAAYYEAILTPTVIFNGLQTVIGGGTEIADGSTYLNIFRAKQFAPTPVKLNIQDFNTQSGALSARVTIVADDYSLTNQSVHFLLIENNVTTEATRVVRAVQTQPITLSGLNNYQDFSLSFTIDPSYVTANLWAAAVVQLSDKTILQTDAYLVQPQYQIRAAMTWGQEIVGATNFNFISEPVWFFNTGETENFTIKLVKDDGPADWYLNFCDEDGLCYPGNIPLPFSLSAGSVTAYHLNLFVGSSGTAHFRFVIESDNIPDYEIPFSYQTDDTSNDDNVLPVSVLSIMQNYPNPFSGNTVFRINAKTASQPVQIDIYNTKGQKVSSLVTSALKAGQNEITWQAAGPDGKTLPSGIYFAGLKDSSDTMTKLLLINK
ncbi:MAG: FlgD immunoglobulin-like domain containing protein [Candidatus Cloacimonadaceae bacterium]